MADAGRTLIDLEAGTCTCPARNATRTLLPAGRGTDSVVRIHQRVAFRFDAAVCGVCPLRPQCVAAARALLQSEAFSEYRQRRVVVEHRLARLVQLGIRQARYFYFGRAKTEFQLYLAATVANLTIVGAKAGLPTNTGDSSGVGNAFRTGTIRSALDFVPVRVAQILTLALFTSASPPKYISLNKAFRPDF